MGGEVTRAVIGAGLMGHGIALVMAKQPGADWLCDLSAEVLVQAQERMHRSLEQLARFGLVEEVDEILGDVV